MKNHHTKRALKRRKGEKKYGKLRWVNTEQSQEGLLGGH